MSGRISRGGLLVILAFLVPVIVELRTLAGLVGIDLSQTEYAILATVIVLGVLGVVAIWNLRVGRKETNTSEGV